MSQCPGCNELIHDRIEVSRMIGLVANHKGSIVFCADDVRCFQSAVDLLKIVSSPKKFPAIRRIKTNGADTI